MDETDKFFYYECHNHYSEPFCNVQHCAIQTLLFTCNIVSLTCKTIILFALNLIEFSLTGNCGTVENRWVDLIKSMITGMSLTFQTDFGAYYLFNVHTVGIAMKSTLVHELYISVVHVESRKQPPALWPEVITYACTHSTTERSLKVISIPFIQKRIPYK